MTEEITTKYFSEIQIEKANNDLNQWLEESVKYLPPYALHLHKKEMKVLIHINTAYSRLVAFVPNWRFTEGNTYTSMIWIYGFYSDNKWRFCSPNETQHMVAKDEASQDFDPLVWSKTRKVIDSYTKGYIKYSLTRNEWFINDDWFYGYLDTPHHVAVEDRGKYSDKEVRNLPESYWISRYKESYKYQEFLLSKTIAIWEEEDLRHINKEFSDEEWNKILSRRNPKTKEDYRSIKKFYKEVLKNNNDSIYVDLMNAMFPGYREEVETERNTSG